jgi:periplasmic copper chaperone A
MLTRLSVCGMRFDTGKSPSHRSVPAFSTVVLTALLFLVTADRPAFAHVTLEQAQSPIGVPYKAVLRVPHGCDGSPTTAIRVRIPEGVIDVKPMPKPGWTLNLIKGSYAKPHTLYRASVNAGVTEIDWSGGNLPDDDYDEFIFMSFLASDLQPGQTLYFPVVQECEKGVHRWIDIPKEGSDYPEPAPALKLQPKP